MNAAARWVGLLAALLVTGCNDAGCSKSGAPSAPDASPSQVFEMLGPPYDNPGDGDALREDPDRYPAGSAAVIGAPDFTFRLAQGGAFPGENVLEIGPTGQAELVFASRRGWVRAAFQLTTEELAGLQRELAAIDVYGLKAGYRDSKVEDGTFWTLHVQAAGQRKQVACTNAFPGAMIQLSYFVRTHLVEPHRAALDQGEILHFEGPYHPPPPWTKGAGL